MESGKKMADADVGIKAKDEERKIQKPKVVRKDSSSDDDLRGWNL